MDGQAILESLDTLWFFSNVFTSPPPTPPLSSSSCEDGNTNQPHLKDFPRTEQPKPRSPTLLKQPIQSPNTGILVETISKSKDYTADTEMQIMKSLLVEALESSSELPWRGRKTKKEKRCCNPSMQRKKNQRWQEVSEPSFLPGHQRMEKTCGFQKLENLHHMKMPPLSDGTAMKEHLKSWAYAVACTVK